MQKVSLNRRHLMLGGALSSGRWPCPRSPAPGADDRRAGALFLPLQAGRCEAAVVQRRLRWAIQRPTSPASAVRRDQAPAQGQLPAPPMRCWSKNILILNTGDGWCCSTGVGPGKLLAPPPASCWPRCGRPASIRRPSTVGDGPCPYRPLRRGHGGRRHAPTSPTPSSISARRTTALDQPEKVGRSCRCSWKRRRRT